MKTSPGTIAFLAVQIMSKDDLQDILNYSAFRIPGEKQSYCEKSIRRLARISVDLIQAIEDEIEARETKENS